MTFTHDAPPRRSTFATAYRARRARIAGLIASARAARLQAQSHHQIDKHRMRKLGPHEAVDPASK